MSGTVALKTDITDRHPTLREFEGQLDLPRDEVSGSTMTKYLRPGLGLPTGIRSGTGSLYFIATDGLGSMDEALDNNGNVTLQELFTPYGTVRYSSGSYPTSYTFTGQRADYASVLYYYNARYYDPVGQQFVSADPQQDGLNRYAYVNGNPETNTDPSGNTMVCAPGTDLCNGHCQVCGSNDDGTGGGGGTDGGGGGDSGGTGTGDSGGGGGGSNPPVSNPPGDTPPTSTQLGACSGGCQATPGDSSPQCNQECHIGNAKAAASEAAAVFTALAVGLGLISAFLNVVVAPALASWARSRSFGIV